MFVNAIETGMKETLLGGIVVGYPVVDVEAALVDAEYVENESTETVLGWPEKLFTRINGVLPGLVDRAIAKQLTVIRRYAGIVPTARPSA